VQGAESRIAGTGGQGLSVREGPGLTFAVLAVLAEGTAVRVIDGPRFDREGHVWYRITGTDERATGGWSAGEFLTQVHGPSPGTVGAPGTVVQSSSPPATGTGRRIMPARVSAYSYQTPGNGAHGSITRTGTVVRWGTVAVDPQVIALGSRLQIEGFDTIFVAEDTGGAVIGNRIEIFFPDEAAAIQFGVRHLQVTVLEDGSLRSERPAASRP
jgi:3D (Asp-Asp-Asp) domain-containing protein